MITLQFSATSGLTSAAIKIYQRGWPSHVDAVMVSGALVGARSDAIGGQLPGVRVRPPGYELWSRTEIVRLPIDSTVETAFWTFLSQQLGKPYDKLAILAFAVQRDWREDGSWFCSELIAAALEKSGWFTGPLSDVANKVTPRDLLLILSPWSRP